MICEIYLNKGIKKKPNHSEISSLKAFNGIYYLQLYFSGWGGALAHRMKSSLH